MTKSVSTISPPIKDLPGWNSKDWSPIILSAFKNQDMTPYCPKWKSVNQSQTWLKFWENIVDHECSMNPNGKYVETTLGIDPVTKMQVQSDGLLQLSWQDVPNYKGDCLPLDYKDPKAIFDPIKNLKCGMFIANKILAAGNSLGRYWSTARSGSNSMNAWKVYAPECF